MTIIDAEAAFEMPLQFGSAYQIEALSLLRIKTEIDELIRDFYREGYERNELPRHGRVPWWGDSAEASKFLSELKLFAELSCIPECDEINCRRNHTTPVD